MQVVQTPSRQVEGRRTHRHRHCSWCSCRRIYINNPYLDEVWFETQRRVVIEPLAFGTFGVFGGTPDVAKTSVTEEGELYSFDTGGGVTRGPRTSRWPCARGHSLHRTAHCGRPCRGAGFPCRRPSAQGAGHGHATNAAVPPQAHQAPQGMMVTAVPSGAQRYIHSATSIGRLTHPWLIGVPKLLCQYVPCNACPSFVKYIT